MNLLLHHSLPPLACVNLVALLCLTWRCRRDWSAPFGKKHLLFCAALLLVQIPVYLFLAGKKHHIYIDEFWYMEAAKNILTHGWAPGYEKSIGWPFLITLSYLLGGVDNFSAIWLGIGLGMLAPLALFGAAFLLTESFLPAAMASALLAFLPYTITWAASAETGVPSLFFICLAAFFSLAYYKTPKRAPLWLALMAWAMAAQVRPENALFAALFMTGIYLLCERIPELNMEFALPCAAAVLLTLPNFLVFAKFQSSANWVAMESGGKASGSNISLANLWFNTVHWGGKLFDGSLHPLPFTLSFVAGGIFLFLRRRRAALWLCVWMTGLYLFYFSAWFNTYGTTTDLFPKTKLFLLFYPALAIAAAYGFAAPWLEKGWRKYSGISIFCGLWLLYAAVPYYSLARIRETRLELETRLLSDMKTQLPPDAIIISNAPVMVRSISFLRTVDTEDFLKNAQLRGEVLNSNCAYYLRDITVTFTQQGFDKLDNAMRANFRLEKEISFSLGKMEYALFRVFAQQTAAEQKPAARAIVRR